MTVFSSLTASLAFGLIDPTADPAFIVVGLGTITIVIVVIVVVIVSIIIVVVVVVVSGVGAGDDVLTDGDEVDIVAKRSLDTLGRVAVAGVEYSGEFFAEI